MQATARWMSKMLRGPKPKVMETVGQNGQTHPRHERLGDFHADSMETGLASTLTKKLHLGGYLMFGGCRLHSLMQYNLEFCAMGLSVDRLAHSCGCRKSTLSQERCRKNEASGGQALLFAPHSQSLRKRTAEVPSHNWLPYNGSEERKLQCSQDDANRDACSKDYSIPREHGGDVDFVSYSSESFRC